jgi:hypothetical protein
MSEQTKHTIRTVCSVLSVIMNAVALVLVYLRVH